MYDVLNVADAILKFAKRQEKTLTPMQLMKLTYIAHGFSLAINHRDLFRNRIEAWQYGPVIPDLYQATKKYGRMPIPLTDIGGENDLPIHGIDGDLIEAVYKKYGHLDGIALSYLTHQSGTPWDQVYLPGANNEISDDIIQKHYEDILNANRAAQNDQVATNA